VARPTDYLVAAAVSRMRNADNSALETLEDLKVAMEAEYDVGLVPERLEYLGRQLERNGFIRVINDTYAGDYITPLSGWGVSYRLNKIKEAEPSNGITYALDRGVGLLNRAFSNKSFWEDLDQEIANTPVEIADDAAVGDLAPSADGFVSLSHNQFKEIDEPTAHLLDELERDNGIPDHPGLKERLVGQIKAGRELLRSGEFQLGIFKDTMLSGLKEVNERYGDHAIGAASSALLTLILHVLGLPGF
jgi:hypothetical protein